ncbi:MAG: tRNA (guanosine(46)-N7)-methyltransferase TrmB, partial [Alphaproteobacteria bacterium]|nr:tRNA (guanosine(46)-N7)-methyltransferase TrmB [Alphaproteobacteria bacterium]
MNQLLSTELPRLSVDKAALTSAPFASQFDSDKDALFLEIGFGGGEHLAQLAANNP